MAARQLAAGSSDSDAMITTMARVLERLVISSGYSPPRPGFRFAAVTQLRVASDAEVDLIEAWLAAHPAGG